jgi:signal transduction histidine kinase
MNAILGMTELVLDTPVDANQRQYLETVTSAAKKLAGMLDDLLDFSKIEAGKLDLEAADFSLRTVLYGALRTLAFRAHMKGLELVSQVRPDVPDALVGDTFRLLQVLLDLIGNAVKFIEEGEVIMTVESDGETVTDDEVRPRFAVTETGTGIAPEKQEAIFQIVEQEDASITHKYGGTELGVTIAARLIALMGGALTVQSEPGRGSTFTFTARFGCRQRPPGADPAQAPASSGCSGAADLIVVNTATCLIINIHQRKLGEIARMCGLPCVPATGRRSAGCYFVGSDPSGASLPWRTFC